MTSIVLVEGNTPERRGKLLDAGSRTASQTYRRSIERHFPDLDICVINAAEADPGLPENVSLKDFDGMVFGGSALHAFDAAPEVTRQVELLRTFADTGKPILGSCWGLQVAVVAAGGSVAPSARGREFPVARKISLTAAGEAHPLYAGKHRVFDALCIHLDEIVSLPADSLLLCSNQHSEVQGATLPVGKSEVWGVQYHPEFDFDYIRHILRVDADLFIADGLFSDEAELLAYRNKFDSLAADPADAAAAWQLGLDDDVLDQRTHNLEIINWVEHQLLRR